MQIALAYALTTSAGLRGLLTLAVVSVAVHFGWFHAPDGFAWIGSTTATMVLVVVAIVDFIGDKIPVVDHALHVVQTVIKPAAAVVLVGGTVHTHSNAELYSLMALGALNALGVHAASATVRGTTTATTGGVGNPFVSLFEDVVSGLMMLVAFVAPVLGAALAIVLTIVIVRFARSAFKGASTLAKHPEIIGPFT